MNRHTLLAALIGSMLATSAMADEATETPATPEGDTTTEMSDTATQPGQGERIQQQLEGQGEMIQNRFQERAQRMEGEGMESQAQHMQQQGERVGGQLEGQGEMIRNRIETRSGEQGENAPAAPTAEDAPQGTATPENAQRGPRAPRGPGQHAAPRMTPPAGRPPMPQRPNH